MSNNNDINDIGDGPTSKRKLCRKHFNKQKKKKHEEIKVKHAHGEGYVSSSGNKVT